jgi:hypothetical protein
VLRLVSRWTTYSTTYWLSTNGHLTAKSRGAKVRAHPIRVGFYITLTRSASSYMYVPRRRFCLTPSCHDINLMWPCVVYQRIVLKYDIQEEARCVRRPEMRISCSYSSTWKFSLGSHPTANLGSHPTAYSAYWLPVDNLLTSNQRPTLWLTPNGVGSGMKQFVGLPVGSQPMGLGGNKTFVEYILAQCEFFWFILLRLLVYSSSLSSVEMAKCMSL